MEGGGNTAVSVFRDSFLSLSILTGVTRAMLLTRAFRTLLPPDDVISLRLILLALLYDYCSLRPSQAVNNTDF